ncbi:hypothetical protein ACHAWF_000308 [Thalassiosira exigua]
MKEEEELRRSPPNAFSPSSTYYDTVMPHMASSSVTKGLVSSLTSLANSVFGTAQSPVKASSSEPPQSPEELLSRIRDDYEERNYLWAGDLDVSSFASDCTFTDPTLSFRGVDKYVENVGNCSSRSSISSLEKNGSAAWSCSKYV